LFYYVYDALFSKVQKAIKNAQTLIQCDEVCEYSHERWAQ